MKAYKKKGIAQQCLLLAGTPAAAQGSAIPLSPQPVETHGRASLHFFVCQNPVEEALRSCTYRKALLRHAVGSLAPAKAAIGKCVYPQSATVEGGCPYFRPICTQRLAWGFTSLFRHVPACKSAMLRLKVMDCFGSRSTYYRYHSGRYLLTPSQQQDVLTVFARAGYDPTTLSFDHYVTQIAY